MKKTNTRSPYQKFADLSNAQKAAAIVSFDEPLSALRARPMSPRMRKLWQKAKNKGGRPRVGLGAKRVLLSVEIELLSRADELARKKNMTRSELFSRGVQTMLKRAG